MYQHYFGTKTRKLAGLAFVGLVGLLVLSGLHTSASVRSGATPQEPVASKSDIHPEFVTNNYKQTNLVSDITGFAQIQDPLLVNPWGLTQLATSPFWVANQGTSTATLYGGDVSGSPFFKNALNVTIPGGLPTGAVSNAGTDFVITSGGGTGPARFMFASITGNIIAWRAGTVASILKSNPGHVYTGLALGNNGVANFLYAADFANKKIDVFNNTFASTTLAGTFTDAGAPALPADYAPHNIQNLGGTLFVAYAKIDPATGNSLPGAGNGYISKFDTNGNFLGRLISNGTLNAPWGLTVSPAGFGSFGNALLVGNFGDGKINAFNITTGALLGTLNDELGSPIIIPGLWAILFGNGVGGGDTSALYFSAGYDSERHGLFGSLRSATPATTSVQFSSSAVFVLEGNTIDISVIRSGDLSVPSTVNYATFDGSPPIAPATTPVPATQGKDYLLAAGTLNFVPGQGSKTFTILIPDDSFQEGPETINLVLSNPTGAALGSSPTAVVTITDNDTPTITPVQRTFIATLDGAQQVPPVVTSGRGVGIVQLAADELSAKVSVYFTGLTGPPDQGGHIHGAGLAGTNAPIIFPFTGLPNTPSGSLNNFTINPSASQVTELKTKQHYINLHTTANPGGEIRGQLFYNAIDETSIFARQQYYDFLNRTPDGAGLAFWIASVDSCGSNILCIENARIDASKEFFITQEFQQTGFFVYRVRRASLGLQPNYGQYIIDKSLLGAGNETNKTAFAEAFAQTGEFLTKYPVTQNGAAFIDAVIATILSSSGVDLNLTNRRPDLVNEYLLGATQTQSRARVIRKAIEYAEYTAAESNPAFVLAEYFGYLRRGPDTAGYNFWLGRLNAGVGNAAQRAMVCAFITSGEYQLRFAPTATRTNAECADVAP